MILIFVHFVQDYCSQDETTFKQQDQPANDVKVMHHLPRAADLLRKHLIDFPTVEINFSSYKRWGMIKFLIIYFMYYHLEKLQKHPNECSILKKHKYLI